jgi:hypothetical protein
MDLYTESEMARKIPLREVLSDDNPKVLPDAEWDGIGDPEIGPTRAVVDPTYDQELPLELAWVPASGD